MLLVSCSPILKEKLTRFQEHCYTLEPLISGKREEVLNRTRHKLSIMTLLIVIFIDGMGLSLLFPLLTHVIVKHPLFSTSIPLTMLYSLIISVYTFFWFIGSTVLGDLSDKIGRKKALMLCLFGTFLGYMMTSFSMYLGSIFVLIVGRAISGITTGSQPIAQASIIDISSKEQKLRNIGFILLSASFGFIAGPLVGGIFSDSSISSLFSVNTPLYIVSFLSLSSALMLFLFFRETRKNVNDKKLELNISKIFSAYNDKRVRRLLIIFSFQLIGWSCFFGYISAYLSLRFNFELMQNSIYIATMAVGFAFSFIFLNGKINKYINNIYIIMLGQLFSGLCIALIFISDNSSYIWAPVFFLGMSMALAYSGILALFSDKVSSSEQGWIMGATGSLTALGFAISMVLVGALSLESNTYPLLASSIFMILASFSMFFSRNKL